MQNGRRLVAENRACQNFYVPVILCPRHFRGEERFCFPIKFYGSPGGSPSQHHYLREGEAPAEPQRMNRQCTGFLGAMSKRLRIPNNRFDSEERYGVS